MKVDRIKLIKRLADTLGTNTAIAEVEFQKLEANCTPREFAYAMVSGYLNHAEQHGTDKRTVKAHIQQDINNAGNVMPDKMNMYSFMQFADGVRFIKTETVNASMVCVGTVLWHDQIDKLVTDVERTVDNDGELGPIKCAVRHLAMGAQGEHLKFLPLDQVETMPNNIEKVSYFAAHFEEIGMYDDAAQAWDSAGAMTTDLDLITRYREAADRCLVKQDNKEKGL